MTSVNRSLVRHDRKIKFTQQLIYSMCVCFRFFSSEKVNDPSRPTYEFLIGPSIDEFPNHLPSQLNILQFYAHFNSNIPESERIRSIISGIEISYERAGVRIRHREAIRIKLKRLIRGFKDLLAKRKVISMKQREKELHFAENIRYPFDVHRENDVEMINIDNIAIEHQQYELQENMFEQDYEPTSESSESGEEEIRRKKIKISPELIQRINSSTASYRACANLIDIGIELTGNFPKEYVTSKSSIWRKISKYRDNKKENLLQNLKLSNSNIVLQFDCKRFHRLNERHLGMEERMIVLSHGESDIPLGLFVIPTHSSQNCANQIIRIIDEFNLRPRIVGLVCDTENVNTGRVSGVCVQVESHLETDVLRLMCRHHIYEVVLKSLFEQSFGTSVGPTTITTFRPLRDTWDEIKRNGFVYEPMDVDFYNDSDALYELALEAKKTLKFHATNKNVRDDYAELTDLSLKFLGVPTSSSFKVPGALNNARWMNKAIYSLKMFLFRHEIGLDQDTVQKLQRFCLFTAIVYVKFWNQCSVTIDAPANDLAFLKEMDYYMKIDNEIALAASTAFKRHLWYLGEELMILSLFSKRVSNEEKDLINLLLTTGASTSRSRNSVRYQDELNDIQNLDLHDFVSVRSNFLLNKLEIDSSFLEECADVWQNIEAFKDAEKKIKDLMISVNDGCERLLRRSELLINNQKVRSEIAIQRAIVSLEMN